MISGIDRLVALSVASANSFDTASHGAEPNIYEMKLAMSENVREAGFEDASLAYTQTVDREDPHEGFIDEASDTMILFPIAAEVIALAQAEAVAQRTTWRGGLAMILTAAGGGQLFFSLFRSPLDIVRCVVGLLLLACAVIMFRDDRRRKRLATGNA